MAQSQFPDLPPGWHATLARTEQELPFQWPPGVEEIDMNHGGQRAGAGRKPKDMVTLAFRIPREAYNELKARERVTGIYRTRIAAQLFAAALAGSDDGNRRDTSGPGDIRIETPFL